MKGFSVRRRGSRSVAAAVELLEGRRLLTTAYALMTNETLVRIDSDHPSVILSSVPVTGVGGGGHLLGIDFRPTDNQMYGVGSDSVLYRVNPSTGVVTAVGPAISPAVGG